MKGVPPISKYNKNLNRVIFAVIFVLILFIIVEPFRDTQRRFIRYIIRNTSTENDYTRLINISFSFLHLPLICQSEQPEFIVLVHSAPENWAKRATIRDTWGHRDNGAEVLFMLGDMEDDTVRNATAEELKTHGDLLQGSFLDTYHNLTYKHVMLLKYAVYHCPKAEYVVKLDDDVFVNMPNLKEFIHLYRMDHSDSSNILCSKMSGPVLRSGKWGVAVEEYPAESYPNYCSGFAIIYPRRAASALYWQAQRHKYFWIDDVHVTGTLAEMANITHTGIERLMLSYEEVVGIADLNFTNLTRPFLFGTMNVNEHQIVSLWNFIAQHTPIASILDFLE